MDDRTEPVRRNANRFRRRRSWSPWLLLIVAVGLAVVSTGWLNRQRLPEAAVQSGEHRLVRVAPDGSLVVVNSVNETEFSIRWLGLQLHEKARAVAWLEDRFADNASLDIRYDRRRLDEQGRLAAYVFQGDELISETLIREGLAIADTHPSDHQPIARRLRRAGS